MVDIVGYVALGLALFAMMSKSIKMLRYIHLTSCVFYTVYGFIACANPVVIGAILFSCIHIFHLYRMHHLKKVKE